MPRRGGSGSRGHEEEEAQRAGEGNLIRHTRTGYLSVVLNVIAISRVYVSAAMRKRLFISRVNPSVSRRNAQHLHRRTGPTIRATRGSLNTDTPWDPQF